MRTFSIFTLGCKVNQYEDRQIREFLENLGLSAETPSQRPDLFVINTCCVTATASAKSRQYVQRAAKINPNAIRVVCGCEPIFNKGKTSPDNGNNLYIVTSRAELPAKLMQIVKEGQNKHIKADTSTENKDEGSSFANWPKLPLLTRFAGHTRAFLKVQDGCDGVCSYCVIPQVRPDVHSKPIEDAVSEAKSLVAAGHKEIVVTGVCLGAYGRETVRRTEQVTSCKLQVTGCPSTAGGGTAASDKSSICDLLKELAGVPGLRVRVSSLEPGDITEELLDVFCGHSNIMPHIHLSMQSGSGRILKRMCRQYDADELRDKIAMIKSRLDRPAITADMIVGFPGETDEDFQETVELAKWAGFSKMHVFAFSARAGTAAAKMKEKVQSSVIKKRSEVLRKLSDELGYKFREQFIGETCEVLIEGSKDGQAFGRCERYFMVYMGPMLLNPPPFCFSPQCGTSQNATRGSSLRYEKNDIIRVRITAATEEETTGTPVANPKEQLPGDRGAEGEILNLPAAGKP